MSWAANPIVVAEKIRKLFNLIKQFNPKKIEERVESLEMWENEAKETLIELNENKQGKQDNNLETESKFIVGAINELKSKNVEIIPSCYIALSNIRINANTVSGRFILYVNGILNGKKVIIHCQRSSVLPIEDTNVWNYFNSNFLVNFYEENRSYSKAITSISPGPGTLDQIYSCSALFTNNDLTIKIYDNGGGTITTIVLSNIT